MSSISIAVIVLACVFGGTLVGLFLKNRLPGHHLDNDSKDTVKLGTGVVATMAALVLGLLVSSAKSTFDKIGDELTQVSAKVVQLDRALVQYGAEAKDIRTMVRRDVQKVVEALTSSDKSQLSKIKAAGVAGGVEDVQVAIRALVPRNDAQRELRSQAMALAADVSAFRTLLLLQQHKSISVPLLVVVVAWLALIFMGFGLFCPRNGTVIAALFLCALSVSAAMFIILEMDNPLEGIVRVSNAPMRTALLMISD